MSPDAVPSFVSTNGRAKPVSFRRALLKGLAPDGGLYVPDAIPRLPKREMDTYPGRPYPEIAASVIGAYAAGEVSPPVLLELCRDAYDFPVPVRPVTERDALLWLDEGPTASFKDFAARVMARLMNHFLREEGRELVILVATSGDTGGAVAAAFHGMERIRVSVLFPAAEISERQRRQMTTLGGNVTAVSVDGKFDDCQGLAKQALMDPALTRVPLSSANSINIGRLVPQAAYYFYGWSRMCESGREVVFSVPSGNFGNLTGGVLARRMGLPAKLFIAAVNENDEFPRFLETGDYEPVVPSRVCPSNAMNVGHPSNLARLVHLYGGRMDERGTIHEKPDMERLRSEIRSLSVSNDGTRETIRKVWRDHRVMLEPHGAVGWKALGELHETKEPGLCLETADPAKFPEEIRDLIGIDPEVPASLSGLEEREEAMESIPADYSALRDLLLSGPG